MALQFFFAWMPISWQILAGTFNNVLKDSPCNELDLVKLKTNTDMNFQLGRFSTFTRFNTST